MSDVLHAIRRKRDGLALAPDQIRAIVRGAADGSVPDYQLAAWLMAAFLRGLDAAELDALTDAMIHSGIVLELASIEGPKVDKHSTGGVGDKVSLCLAPLVAACGATVPMISGRGLGHTGGTLDKLEAIPGYRTDLPIERFVAICQDAGWSIIGQTADLCPADKKLYALRDVTGTVESIPLIAASIMGKKLAAGLDALVLDVKVGSGAFMKRAEDARRLAETMAGIGRRAGKRVTAMLTDMDRPLGRAVGNAVETAEAVDVLRGGGPPDLVALTVALGAEMLRLCGIAGGEARMRAAIASGAGYDRWARGVRLHGGDPDAALAVARERHEVRADRGGFVAAIDGEKIGRAAVRTGAGRTRVEDRVDPSVGILIERNVGDAVRAGDVLAVVLGREDAVPAVRAAYTLADAPPPPRPLVLETLAG